MGKRPPQWPPLPGPVPDKRLVYADKPDVRIQKQDDIWVTVGWLDEINGIPSSDGVEWTSAHTHIGMDWSIPNETIWTTDLPEASERWKDVVGRWVPDTVSTDTVMEKHLKDQLAAARDEVRATLEVSEFRKSRIERLQQELRDLGSWLLNVAPVEDPEIPGLYLCGVCHARTDRPHKDDCPLASERQ
jgi:hypothetical protein